VRAWRVPLRTLALGIGGLFGFHFLLFMALRLAPPLEANLVNYLWPLLIVLLTPLVLPGWTLDAAPRRRGDRRLRGRGARDRRGAGGDRCARRHGLFARRRLGADVGAVFAADAARGAVRVVGDRRVRGGVGRAGAAMPRAVRAGRGVRAGDGLKLAALGLGPMGTAFYLWDYAMKRGDPRVVGTLAYATPVLSTALLALATGRALEPSARRRDAARRGRRGDRASGPQVGPARLLLLHDLDDAGLHVADAVHHVSLSSFWLVIVFSHATTLTPAPIASAMRLAATESAFSMLMPGP
jgi:hypothetical protein